MKTPLVTVRAKVYQQRGEKSAHAIRAKVIGSDMKVSCPSVWRDAWTVGQVIEFVGRVVSQSCGSAYFKATEQRAES